MSHGIECNEFGNVALKTGYVVGKRYVVMSRLGEGGCGTVYKVFDLKTNKKLALKAEANCIEGGSVLKLEAQILRKLIGKPQFPQMKWAGKREKFSYVVMTLLGDSLSYLLRLHGSKINSISTQIRLGVQLLHALKTLHDIGVVHRDIKPGNLAMGHPDSPESMHTLYVLDFGLAREFMLQTNGRWEFRRRRNDCLFRGTSRYCSLNVHEKGDQCRADDLWSMMYMLAEMRRALPWRKLQEKADVQRCKINTTDAVLFMNSPSKLSRITSHLRTLGYYNRPDYGLIYEVFLEIMKEEKIKMDELYDWEDYVQQRDAAHKKRQKLPSKKSQAAQSAEPVHSPGEGIRKQASQTSLKSAEPVNPSAEATNDPTLVTAAKSRSDEKGVGEEEINILETQDDPESWGDFPADDFYTNPTGL
ncbi:unnamed protein product, partial [Mesorhabditis belari]|uniref:Protein kinase domain-containing protein n=1 Tax=Mesorhabditis belari TaxID=2138241 RepID=A0AAF3FEQ8_9BILA